MVLPEPLGPIRAVTAAAGAVKVIPSTARTVAEGPLQADGLDARRADRLARAEGGCRSWCQPIERAGVVASS